MSVLEIRRGIDETLLPLEFERLGAESVQRAIRAQGFDRALVREIHPAAGPWQDIKDAPKDGSWVLLLCFRKAGGGPIGITGRWFDRHWYIPGWTGMVIPTRFALVNLPGETKPDVAVEKVPHEP